MKSYLNNNFLKSKKKNVNMPIVKALLKYDQSNFTLLILEYVEPEQPVSEKVASLRKNLISYYFTFIQ